MEVTTKPNPEYLRLAAPRGGKVRADYWSEAIRLANLATKGDVQVFLDAVKGFPDGTTREEGKKRLPGLAGIEKRAWDAARGRYWTLRIGNCAPNEFNGFNKKWTEHTEGRPPIGPDGLWIELEHDVERYKEIKRTFDATNIFEAFHRVHTLRTPQVALRWRQGIYEARSPHDPNSWILKELLAKPHLRVCGDPLKYDVWP
jgi:hypothetical protein